MSRLRGIALVAPPLVSLPEAIAYCNVLYVTKGFLSSYCKYVFLVIFIIFWLLGVGVVLLKWTWACSSPTTASYSHQVELATCAHFTFVRIAGTILDIVANS